jgi:hypothetical protein
VQIARSIVRAGLSRPTFEGDGWMGPARIVVEYLAEEAEA